MKTQKEISCLPVILNQNDGKMHVLELIKDLEYKNSQEKIVANLTHISKLKMDSFFIHSKTNKNFVEFSQMLQSPLSMYLTERVIDKFSISISYDSDLFDLEIIKDLLYLVKFILTQILADSSLKFNELRFLNKFQEKTLHQWNKTDTSCLWRNKEKMFISYLRK
jgi:hypothetical protein